MTHQTLPDGIVELGLDFDQEKIDKLFIYTNLLLKWNKTFSLTNITNIEQIIIYHLLDGLTTVKYIENYNSIIDVGSGMGVPGIIIAIWFPHKNISLIDSSKKKSAFLKQVVIELGLTNVDVICSRVEDYKPLKLFDLAISRAFSSSKLFIDLVGKFVSNNLLLMKSSKVDSEINEIANYKYNITQVNLPFSDDIRYLLKIEL